MIEPFLMMGKTFYIITRLKVLTIFWPAYIYLICEPIIL